MASAGKAVGRSTAFERLFDPRSIAVIGASAAPGKWGHELADAANRSAAGRQIYFVNHKGGEILGRRAYTHVRELPEAPDVAVISVPIAALDRVVADCLGRSVRYLVVITAGLAELGGSHRARQTRLRDRVREAGARLIGPNCYGVFDAQTNFSLMIADPPPGQIGLVSQSGNLVIEMAVRARRDGVGFSRIATLGNQADVTAAELVSVLADHNGTELVALYLEDSNDLPALTIAIADARRQGKPTVALLGGGSEAGARAALHHTGSSGVAPDAGTELARAGARLVGSPSDLISAARILLAGKAVAGRRLGIICDGGGHGVVAADIAAALGFDVRQLSPGLQSRLRRHFPHSPGLSNPVDLVGAESDLSLYAKAIEAVASSAEVDAVLLTGYFGGYSYASDSQAQAERSAADKIAVAMRRHETPLIVHSAHASSASLDRLRHASVPVYDSAADALRALAVTCQ
jgi:acetate---CoA ligase (ADP-forming)